MLRVLKAAKKATPACIFTVGISDLRSRSVLHIQPFMSEPALLVWPDASYLAVYQTNKYTSKGIQFSSTFPNGLGLKSAVSA